MELSRTALACLVLAALPPAARADDPDLFESRVRPVLAERCFKCHSAKAGKAKGGLRLDARDAVVKGGDTGPAVVPGKPGESLLLQAVRHAGDLKMPPDGKLPDGQIAALEEWVRRGAPWPADPAGAAAADPSKAHWAFQPVRRPAVPVLSTQYSVLSTRSSVPGTPIDAFVVAKLQAAGLSPAPPADGRTLLRRVAYDLTGLPPTPDEVDALLSDKSPDAYEKVVDRLLASPAYGERWGRHWLDVARYADTKDGVLMYGADRLRPYAYTYRDYVIRALNADTPFDRFVHEQLAADLIAPPVEPWRLAALGFLTLGRMFDNNVHDVLDDRIDTTSRGFLGLTVSCARCHDHKYDPIPTADYYSLYGVFASSEAPLELPLIGRPEDTPGGPE